MLCCLFALLLSATLPSEWQQGDALAEPAALVHAHAHNDYEHRRPLFDALEHGICSVEADIWLIDGKLLVAHERKQVDPKRTLQTLYLDPLQERVRLRGGHVYRQGTEFVLLIELKSEGESTYAALREALRPYAAMLTAYRAESAKRAAVSVIVTGNVPKKTIAAEPARLVAIDGDLSDLDSPLSRHVIPWISANWLLLLRNAGSGDLEADQLQKLRGIVEKAHAKGRKVRFWATPNTPKLWKLQREAGVDLLNADDLDGVRDFLLAEAKQPRPGP